MRVVEARSGIVGGSLRKDVGNAAARWSERKGVLLVLRDEEGRLGFGEASPLPGYSPDLLEDARRALAGASAVVRSFDDAEALPAIRELSSTLGAPPSARFALETALLDLLGQRVMRPVSALLTEQPQTSLRLCALLDAEPASWLEGAREAERRGIHAFKVKVGRPGQRAEELVGLRNLREILPPDRMLRLDANGAWTVEEARSWMTDLAPLCIEFVEQPVPPGELARLGSCAVPWAADESLRDDQDVEQLLRSPCGAFVLKPAVLGGFFSCLELARRALEWGIPSLASHLFDGPVALAACSALALALPGPQLASGLDAHAALAAWPQLEEGHSARVEMRFLPGLGFTAEQRRRMASWIP